jgi:hypothetical protein
MFELSNTYGWDVNTDPWMENIHKMLHRSSIGPLVLYFETDILLEYIKAPSVWYCRKNNCNLRYAIDILNNYVTQKPSDNLRILKSCLKIKARKKTSICSYEGNYIVFCGDVPLAIFRNQPPTNIQVFTKREEMESILSDLANSVLSG